MATPIKKTPETRNAKRTSVSISGPAYMVAVGGAPRGSKPKTRNYTSTESKKTTGEKCCITPRYLRPSTGSCHDLCKNGMKNESLELRKPTTRFGSRKMSFIKYKGVKRTVVPVEIKKITKTKLKSSPDPKICAHDEPVVVIKRENSLPSKRIGVSIYGLSINRKSTQNEIKMPKNHVKAKPISSSILNGQKNKKEIKNIKNTGIVRKTTCVERVASMVTHAGSLPRNHKLVSPLKDENSMTKNMLGQLLAEKITEMTLHEAEIAESEFVPPTVEIIESPPTVKSESNNLPSSESSQSSSGKQVLKEECENANNEQVTASEDEGNYNYRVVICEDKENGGFKVKLMRGRVVDVESEDDGPRRLKFRRGKILEDNGDKQSIGKVSFKKKLVDEATNDCKNGSEKVTLKHQELQEKKEAQELLNRVIEETANKLVVDRKTKVRALVGAFESVISLQDDTPSSE